ncbi:MAG: hypothetical protein ACR2OX_01210 [Methyloligellaceae bacterium]
MQPFPLVRYFSIVSAIAVAIAMIAVTYILSEITTKQLIEERQAANTALTRTFSNSIWPEFRTFVLNALNLSGEELRAHPQIESLSKNISNLTRGLSVVKVKVFAANGNTVFSTQASQIGDRKGTSTGFIEARKGRITSELSHRNAFDAIERQIFDVDVISSYVPIRNDLGQIEGVFEIYDNVTNTLEKVAFRRNLTIAYVGLLFLLLYCSLLLIVRRASRVMQEQRFLLESHREIYS